MGEGKLTSMFQESDEVGGEVMEEWRSLLDSRLLRKAWLGPEGSASREDSGEWELTCRVQESNRGEGVVTREWKSLLVATFVFFLELSDVSSSC